MHLTRGVLFWKIKFNEKKENFKDKQFTLAFESAANTFPSQHVISKASVFLVSITTDQVFIW